MSSIPFPKKVETEVKPKSVFERLQHCPKCGAETRIVSNDQGVAAFCGPCNQWYPISAAASLNVSINPGRGIAKKVYCDVYGEDFWSESPPRDDE